MLPYLYSEFMKAALERDMMIRPLAFDYPEDEWACGTRSAAASPRWRRCPPSRCRRTGGRRCRTDRGLEGFWNDMNEPAIFSSEYRAKGTEPDVEHGDPDQPERHSILMPASTMGTRCIPCSFIRAAYPAMSGKRRLLTVKSMYRSM